MGAPATRPRSHARAAGVSSVLARGPPALLSVEHGWRLDLSQRPRRLDSGMNVPHGDIRGANPILGTLPGERLEDVLRRRTELFQALL